MNPNNYGYQTAGMPQGPSGMGQQHLPPPPQQGMLNGNYQQQQQQLQTPPPPQQQQQQQQLTTNMSNLTLNPMKQHLPPPPPNNSGPIPNMQSQQLPPTSAAPPPLNNNYGPGPQVNGQSMQPPTSMYPPTTSSPLAGPSPQAVAGGANQMTVNSPSVAGLPHMPPPKAQTSSPYMSSQSSQTFGLPPPINTQPPIGGMQSQYSQQMPGQQSMGAPPTSKTPSSSMPGMPIGPSIGQNQGQSDMRGTTSSPPSTRMSSFPAMPPTSSAQSGLSMPPTSGAQSMSGMPGSGMPPSSGAPSYPGMPPTSTPSSVTQSMPGIPPMPGSGMPPSSGAPTYPGMPPTSTSSSGIQSMPGMPPMPGSGMPPSSGAPTYPGMPPTSTSSSGIQSMPGMPPMPGSGMPLSSGAPTHPGITPGSTPSSGMQTVPGMPPMPGSQASLGLPPSSRAQSMPGMPPMSSSGMPPSSGAPSYPGMPPTSTPSLGGQSMPGMPPMPGPRPSPGMGYPPGPQAAPFPSPNMPPMPGPQSGPGMPPTSGVPTYPSMPPTSSAPGMPPMPGTQAPGMPPQMMGQMPNYGAPPMPGGAGYPNQMMPPQPGQQMPGRPGFNQQQPGQGGMYPPQQYQQQPRRLDPDQMPNPIQVMIENQRNAGGAFVTNQAGLLPPLVTTKFVVQDQGNSSPRFLRSSLYCIPSSADLLKTTALPFNLIVSPFARTLEGEYEPPIIDFGELGPIRCNRCKAYMSPNMQFVDAGRRFQCLMCKVTTEVPTEYFQHLDHTGQRVDKYERPELVLGTYEFLATKDYCRNNVPPQVPAFIFVIDVSYNTIKSGLVHLVCSQMKRILKNLPIDQGQDKTKMRVGFITYNSSVHFYNIKSNLGQPQMMVVGDVHDMFMPLLDGFLCHPEESEEIIDALMEQIPKMFVDTKETETILYPAIQAGLEALKASNCAGKLLVFNSTLPIADAPGKLRNREDRKLLGTEKEKTVLIPQCNSYNTLGQECVQNGCSVDLFLFNNAYIDIATIGQVARLTGGEIFKYTYFQADVDGKRLIEDIVKNVSRPIAFDSVMRVRTSAGIRATDFYGHFFMTNTTDVELASVDSTKSIAIEIKHDDKLPPEENVYLQIALLYTSCSGQRRLRILNLALRATTMIADVFKSCDLDAMMLFFAKQACFKLMELTPKAVKDNLIHRSAQILACYRKHCTSPTSAGQLILPECLKLLPLYVSCLLKNDAISGGADMTLDDRSYVIHFVLSMDLNLSVSFFYPRFIPIHNVDANDTDMPMSIRCTHEKMSENGAYILENGVYLFVWLGQSLSQDFVQPLFGVQCTQQVNAERFTITGDSKLAQRVNSIIEMIMAERTRYMRVTCVRQNDKLESVFRHFLIEDRGTDGSASYVDFLCHMHKEIKDLLS